jgi:hypothetical protein
MSDFVGGVISLSPNQNGAWYVIDNSPGWPGNLILQPTVIEIVPEAVPLTVNFLQYQIQAFQNPDGSFNYQWWIAIQNETDTTVLFQLSYSLVWVLGFSGGTMKSVSVVCDSHGKILAIFPAPPTDPESRRFVLGYKPGSGEEVHVVEIPAEFEGKSQIDLHTKCRLKARKGTAKFVPIEGAKKHK